MSYTQHYSDYKWIKVKRYTQDEAKSWEQKYKDLEEHHLKETTFLIDEIRRLAKQLDNTNRSVQIGTDGIMRVAPTAPPINKDE